MKKLDKNDVQIDFLNKIKELIPDNFSFVDELSEILEISIDSIYRRLRGETALSIHEVAILCKKFNISFDMFTQGVNNVTFAYNVMHSESEFKQHLSSILYALQKIVTPKNKQITYAANDIPIFHHFNFRELGAFKMFYWMKTVNNTPSLEDKLFDFDAVDPEILEIGKQIFNTYQKAPSIEIWSDSSVNSLIKQIEFYWDSGVFKNKDDALLVCRQVLQEFELIRKQAANSLKEDKVSKTKQPFMLYHSDIEIGNNTIFIKREHIKTVYITFNTFNALISPNVKFIGEIELWLDNFIKKSTLISGVAQKHRYQFFKRMIEKLNKLEEKIKNEGG